MTQRQSQCRSRLRHLPRSNSARRSYATACSLFPAAGRMRRIAQPSFSNASNWRSEM
jgi:hypothetical protein